MIERQTGATISAARLSVLLKRGGLDGAGHREAIHPEARPAKRAEGHTLTGRQDRQAVDRVGLRLQLRRA